MRTLVTGASGFVGLALCRALSKTGHQVRALVRPSSQVGPLQELGVELQQGDLGDSDSLVRAVRGQELVLHNAAAVGDWGTRAHFFDINVEGTRRLVNAVRQSPGTRLVHTSSLTVLGIPHRGQLLDEASGYDPAPKLDYVESKIGAELVIREAWDDIPATIVRPAAIWGPGDHVFLPRWHALARRGRLFRIGNGRNHVGMTHIDNFVHALLLVAASKTASKKIYHITDGVDRSSDEVFATLARAFGYRPPRLAIPVVALHALGTAAQWWSKIKGAGHPPQLTPYAVELLSCDARYSIDRARADLGYAPIKEFEQGVTELAQWFRAGAERRPENKAGGIKRETREERSGR